MQLLSGFAINITAMFTPTELSTINTNVWYGGQLRGQDLFKH